MAEPDDIVLVYLRRIDEKVDALSVDVRELKEPVTALEVGQAALRQGVIKQTVAQIHLTRHRHPAGALATGICSFQSGFGTVVLRSRRRAVGGRPYAPCDPPPPTAFPAARNLPVLLPPTSRE